MSAVGPSGLPILTDTFVRLTRSPVASIAKIRGCVRGVSSEFVLACDMRFASRENTYKGHPEVGVGLHPGGGGTERLAPGAWSVAAARSKSFLAPTTSTAMKRHNMGTSTARFPMLPAGRLCRCTCAKDRHLRCARDRGSKASYQPGIATVVDNLLSALNSFQTALTWPEALQRVEALLRLGLQQDRNFERQWPAMLDSLVKK